VLGLGFRRSQLLWGEEADCKALFCAALLFAAWSRLIGREELAGTIQLSVVLQNMAGASSQHHKNSPGLSLPFVIVCNKLLLDFKLYP
jgi:hypothetical protein